MKNRHATYLVLTATLLFVTVLMVDITFVTGIEWLSETQLTTDPAQDMSPSIVQAGDGTIWVIWVSNRMGLGNDELFYKTSTDYGLNWSPETRLTDSPSYDESPSIMQANNGMIWVVWASYRTGNYELFYKTFDGASWSSDIQLTEEPNQDMDPSIMQATNGLIWVVWYSNRSRNNELFYKTYNGSAWSTETQLTDNPSVDKYPSIVQASDGMIWVVWASYRTGNYELFYKTFNGTAWSSEKQLTNDPAFDMAPSIAQARDRTIWVVWQSERAVGAQDELYYKIYDGSAWSSDTQLTNNRANDIAPSIAQINDRKIWVVWQADRNEDFDIYYKTSSEIIVNDVAITSVSPSATTVKQGEIVSIGVRAENHGDENETFNVNCYVNTTAIGSTTITLSNGTSKQLTFAWNTSDIAVGKYTISATASIVFGELPVNTVDNTFRDGILQVRLPLNGDVNGDDCVDVYDLARIGKAFGTRPGNANWDGACDLNKDGVVSISDMAIFCENYGAVAF